MFHKLQLSRGSCQVMRSRIRCPSFSIHCSGVARWWAKVRSFAGGRFRRHCLRIGARNRTIWPKVGLEPTTLRLTARILPCSAVLDIALSCLFLCRYSNRFDEAECRDYPEIPTILKECPYKSPYSVVKIFWPTERGLDLCCRSERRSAWIPLRRIESRVAKRRRTLCVQLTGK
jgi:hypothetical protein